MTTFDDLNTDAEFVPETVHKRDVFSETISGHLAGHKDVPLVLRKLSGVPFWAKPIAWFLARKEIRGLRACKGIDGAPALIRVDREGLLRSWSVGTPLQLAKPDTIEFYKDARRILAEMRQRGVTHNDIAKPQNWLQRPDGGAAVIDFQLASVHRRKGRLYRLMAYEDLRHLIKQKKYFAPHLLTASERAVLQRRSLPGRIWRATAKPVYVFVTRKLFNWSDGEGTGNRLVSEGPELRARLKEVAGVSDVALAAYSVAGGGIGVYAFVEGEAGLDTLRAAVSEKEIELLQPVAALPRDEAGEVREDIMALVATNQLDELEWQLGNAPELKKVLAPIVKERLNLTDRGLK